MKPEEIAPKITETQTVNIYRDEVLQVSFKDQTSDFCALHWMLSNNSSSCDWALRYEGYKVELIDDQTGEKTYWKHSGQKR